MWLRTQARAPPSGAGTSRATRGKPHCSAEQASVQTERNPIQRARVDLILRNRSRLRSPVLKLRDDVSGTQGVELLVAPMKLGSGTQAVYRLPTDRRYRCFTTRQCHASFHTKNEAYDHCRVEHPNSKWMVDAKLRVYRCLLCAEDRRERYETMSDAVLHCKSYHVGIPRKIDTELIDWSPEVAAMLPGAETMKRTMRKQRARIRKAGRNVGASSRQTTANVTDSS